MKAISSSLVPVVLALAVAGCQVSTERPRPDVDGLVNAGSAASLIAGNAGRLIGKVKGPIAFQVETHGGSLIAPGTSRMRVLAADAALEAASGAKVEVTDAKGAPISYGPVTTDAEGNFSFRKLKPSASTLFVQATYTVAGREVVLRAAAAAPRKAGKVEAAVNPASSLVVKKALEMVRSRVITGGSLSVAALDKLVAAVGPELDEKTLVAAAILPNREAAFAFDALLESKPALRDKLRTLVSKTPLASVLDKTPEATALTPTAPASAEPSVAPTVAPAPPVEQFGVFTMAGSGTAGYADGPQQNARFNVPFDVATDAKGNVYVADSENHGLRRIAPTGVVSTLAGGGVAGFADGLGSAARFKELSGVATDKLGFMYVADYGNHAIRRVSPGGLVVTIAGDGTPGFVDGVGKAARFNHPTDLTVDSQGNVYVSDEHNHAVRKIAPDGTVTTLVGGQGPGFVDGDRATARINMPSDVAIDVAGNLYVADTENHAIRKLTPEGQLTTLAGAGEPGYADGAGSAARFDTPYGVVVDDQRRIYVADANNHRIRLITPSGEVTTFKGTGTTGYGVLEATPGLFNLPSGAAIRRNAKGVGEVYIADAYNHQIRKFEVPIANEENYVPK